MEWRRALERRVVILGNLNPHISQWNTHCGEKRDAMELEILIENYDLICNNESRKAIRPTRGQATFIIDLTFTMPELGPLDSWIIDKRLTVLSDHELIVFDMDNLDETIDSMRTIQEVTGWAIKVMSEDKL